MLVSRRFEACNIVCLYFCILGVVQTGDGIGAHGAAQEAAAVAHRTSQHAASGAHVRYPHYWWRSYWRWLRSRCDNQG